VSGSSDGRGQLRAYCIIALASFAILVYEIAAIRLLSVVLWYHFAFLSISLAMLGIGVPGVWFSLGRPRRVRLDTLLRAGAIALPLSVAGVVRIAEWLPTLGPAVDLLGWKLAPEPVRLAGIVAAMLAPLLLIGSVVCLLLVDAPGRRIGRMYGADLFGATLGAIAVVPLMAASPTPTLLAGLGLLLAAASVLADASRWRSSALIGAALLASLAWGEPYRVRTSKVYPERSLDVLHEKWTPLARLTVLPGVFWRSDPEGAFGWGMGSRYSGGEIEQLWVEQDGSAGTPITRLDRPIPTMDHLDYDVTSIGYQLRPPDSVCIVGAGGGRDILTALKAGARHVDAVELNPGMIEIVTRVFGDFSGDVYHLPNVVPVASEGRSFLTRTDRRYDLIQISLVDSWAATTAGAYALSESYLYTTESMRLYLDRASPSGLVSVSRWMQGWNQMEAVRLVLLAKHALALEGVEEPQDHLVVVQGGRIATALVSRRPFARAEIAELDRIAELRGFTRHWPPPGGPGPRSLIAAVLTEGPGLLESRGLRLAAPTDDKPFFFQSVRTFSRVEPALLRRLSFNDQAALLPRRLLGGLAALSLVLFFAPFLFRGHLRRERYFWRGSAYFLCIGLGFMLIEMPLIQKLMLFLGHPSHATTVGLGSILSGSAMGSLAAARLDPALVTRGRLLLPVSIAGVAWLLPGWLLATLGAPLPARVGLSVAVAVPVGFVLGFALPTGMARFGGAHRAWFWAVNGAASVLASVGSIALGPYTGIQGVLWIGVACYLAACVLLPPSPTRPSERPEALRRAASMSSGGIGS
jgi:hypothetical protein